MATHSSILAWKIPWTEEPVDYSPRGRKESDMTYRLNNKQLIKFSVQFLKVTFHLQLRHNVGSFPRVVQYILELILHPIVCTFRFPTTSNH